jgi:hypothetical protein
MKQTNEMDAVGLVRRIRDAQAEQLADKSATEIMEFFNRAAGRARKRGRKPPIVSKGHKGSNEGLRRPGEKRRRRGTPARP